MRKKFCLLVLLVFVACLIAGGAAWAEDINHPEGPTPGLRNHPIYGIPSALFPDLDSPSDNTVTVNGSAVNHVDGGISISEDVHVERNKVYIKGGDIDDWVDGGLTRKGNAIGNSVTISGGVLRGVAGGLTQEGNAIGNSVEVSGVNVVVRNGVAGGNSLKGGAISNSVKISGGTVGSSDGLGFINGGYSRNGDATSNDVTISGGTVNGGVDGVIIQGKGNATYNSVEISDGTVKYITGGGVDDEHDEYGNIISGSGMGDVTNNTVTVRGGTVIENIRGGNTVKGNVENNIVTVSGGTVGGTTVDAGGYTQRGDITGNTVFISDVTVRHVSGGQSGKGNVTDNEIIISGETEVDEGVVGGWSNDGNVTDNIIIFSGKKVGDGIERGWIGGGWTGSGDIRDNTITFSGGEVTNISAGSVSDKGNVTGNSITITGGTVIVHVDGGWVENKGDVIGNSITITGGTMNSVSGGNSKEGNVVDNSIIVNDGTVNWVEGGSAEGDGNVTGNSITVSGGTVKYGVSSGGSNEGNVVGNSITISGGTVNSAEGGWAEGGGNVTGNSITISGGTVEYGIRGGYTDHGYVKSNDVIIRGNPKFIPERTGISGGLSGENGTVTGNALHIINYRGEGEGAAVLGLYNFDIFNFTIDPGQSKTLTVSEDIYLEGKTIVMTYPPGYNANSFMGKHLKDLIMIEGRPASLVDFPVVKAKVGVNEYTLGLSDYWEVNKIDPTPKPGDGKAPVVPKEPTVLPDSANPGVIPTTSDIITDSNRTEFAAAIENRIIAGDLESQGDYVVVKESLAKNAAQDALTGNERVDYVISLPVISADVKGDIAAIAFNVTGAELMTDKVGDIKLVKILSSSGNERGQLFTYESEPAEFEDTKFTLLHWYGSDVYKETDPIKVDETYRLVVFIEDGGDSGFDLDGKKDGRVIDPVALFSTTSSTQSSGCDAAGGLGIGALIVMSALMVTRKRRR